MSAAEYSVNDLAFRAACNAAVPESKRPLRRRVMQRLAASPHTQALAIDLLPRVSPEPGHGLYDLLAADPRWQTLVAETVADTLGWDDLANRGISLGQRLLTILRKFFEGDAQHGARIVVAGLGLLGSFWLSIRIADDSLVLGPVELKLKVSAIGTVPVPATFGPLAPVEVNVVPKPQPLVVDVRTGTQNACTANACRNELLRVVEQLGRTNQALAELAKPGINPSQWATLGDMEGHLRNLVKLQTDMVELNAGQPYDVPVDEDHPRLLLVRSLDPAAAGNDSVNVVVCLDAVEKKAGVKARAKYSIGRTDQGGCSRFEWITEGQIQSPPVGQDQWEVTVHSIKRRLNGQGRATLSLRPPVPHLRNVVTADTTD